jgi:hypothetical protein
MLFKPNFCCNCGIKIERAEWSVLTSRRFCEVCAVEYKGHDWLPRAVVIAGILLGVFGLGSFVGSSNQSPPETLKAGQGEPAHKLTVGGKQPPGIKEEERFDPSTQGNPGTAAIGLPGSSGAEATKEQPRISSAASDEPVHFCGAMTKKGKPCSRRVKSKGRCWQHVGQPSALVSQSPPDVY